MRLIDADVLVKHKVTGEIGNLSGDFVPGFAIANAPTIEAEPVRHGKWGEAEIVGYNGYHAVYARPCMLCGSYTREHKPPYCSNCGAKMDEGG